MRAGSEDESIDDLFDRAVQASTTGDDATAAAHANQVLAVDGSNQEAEELLSEANRYDAIRRLTMLFVDLVDSTDMSRQVDPESYRAVVVGYRKIVEQSVHKNGGYIDSVKGDGLLALFGHPVAHEDDPQRAAAAGLEITRAVGQLSDQADRRFGVTVAARIGIHRGITYLDTHEGDAYGFAVNLAARILTLAEPGTVAVSGAVAALIEGSFDLTACTPKSVKGLPDPVAYWQVHGERSVPGHSAQAPLVGRLKERARLQRMWEEVAEGARSPAGVALRGEAGIGKTRLVQSVADQVVKVDGQVIALRGSPQHSAVGLYPVRRFLEHRCGITRVTPAVERLGLLEAAVFQVGMDPETSVPLLAPVLGVNPERGYSRAEAEGTTLYQLIAQAVQTYLEACLQKRPGLIIAEDVHWFDDSTAEIISALLNTEGRRHLVVVTGRDGAWTQRGWPVELIELGPLSTHESQHLIQTLNPHVTPAQREQVLQRCDGVPFYIEHVVAALDTSQQAGSVPEALYSTLFAKLPADPHIGFVVEAAAVVGRSGDLSLLRAVLDEPEYQDIDVPTAVQTLARAGVLTMSGTQRWRFRHELIREVALEAVPPSRLRDIHTRVGDAMVATAELAEPDWPVVATHYHRSSRPSAAVEAYQLASVLARRRGALGEATGLLSEALEHLTLCPAEPARDRTEISIRLERGFLVSAAEGSWSGTGPAEFERCLALALDGNHDDELFDTLSALIGYYIPRAELHRARYLLDSLAAKVTRHRPWSYRAIESSLGSVLWLQGEFNDAREHLESALVGPSAADPTASATAWWVSVDPVCVAHSFLGLLAMTAGDIAAAHGHLDAATAHSCSLGFPQNAQNRLHALYMRVWVLIEHGRLDRATDVVDEMRTVSKSAGLDFWRLVGATTAATVAGLRDLERGSDAERLQGGAIKLAHFVDGARHFGLNSYLTFHDAVVARILIACGDVPAAAQRLDAALTHTAANGMCFYDAELQRIRAHCLDDAAERRKRLTEALAVARHQGAALFELRCLLDLVRGGDLNYRAELSAAVDALPSAAGWAEVARAQDNLDSKP